LIQTGVQSAPGAAGALERRFAELGVPLVSVDGEGAIVARAVDGCGAGPRMAVASPMFGRALARAVERWDGSEDEAGSADLWPGCTVVPLGAGRRRRGAGRRLAVLVSDAMLESEQFNRLADAAGLDVSAARARVERDGLLTADEAGAYARLLPGMAEALLDRERTREEIDALSQQLAETYEELSLVYKLSARMTVTEAPETFLEEALSELQEVLGLGWLVLLLIEDDRRLGPMTGKMVMVGRPPVDHASLRGITAEALNELECSHSARVLHDDGPWRATAVGRLADQVLFVPLIGDEKPLGLILGAEKLDGSELSSVDSKLVTSVAQNIAIFVENAMLYEDLQDMFMGMLRSLVNAIDAKDTYTCGHSERVAWLGRELGRAAGLDEATVERLHLSGLLHDVGKIGVPEAVLTKAGRLTDREFTIIKAHPRIGARIVEGVRQMQDLIPGVLYHHERYDGRGYPDGLAGERIPLFGRVLALADSFDAMSSNRTYRAAMPHETVLEEVRRCAGAQFDPALAEVFLTLDFEPYRDMVAKHQQRQSLLRRELGDLA